MGDIARSLAKEAHWGQDGHAHLSGVDAKAVRLPTRRTGKIPPFGILPSKPLFDTRLSNWAKVVLATMCCHTNKTRICWAAQRTIATKLKVSRQHVNNAYSDLRKAGAIVQHEKVIRKNGGKGITRFRIVFPEEAEKALSK